MYIFLHMHKCAGSTVVRKARQAKLRLAHNHRNGNLVKEDGKNVRYNRMTQAEVSRLLHDVNDSGVEFFAIEWDFPKVEYFDCGLPVDLFTVMRDPFARAVSNYRFAKLSGSVHRDVAFQQLMNWSYTKSGPLARSSNYYTRKLCAADSLAVLDDRSLERAIEVLDRFRSVILLERDDLDVELGRIGIEAEVKPAKQTASLVRHGVTEKDLVVSDADRAWFEAENALDFALLQVLGKRDQALKGA